MTSTETDGVAGVSETDPKYVERVRALLAKAESTDSESEREALTERAQFLMTKYSIEAAHLDNAAKMAGDKDSIDKIELVFTGIFAKQHMRNAFAIARSNDAQAFYSERRPFKDYGRNGKARYGYEIVVTVFAFKKDLEMIRFLDTSVRLQLATSMKDAETDGRISTYSSKEQFLDRRTFIEAYASGLESKLHAARRTAAEKAEQTTPGTALVLRSRKQSVKEYVAQRYSVGKGRTSRHQSGNLAAAVAGHRAGQNANTGQTGIDPRRNAIGG